MFTPRMGIATAASFCYRLGVGFRAGADLIALIRAEAKSGSPRHREALQNVAAGLANGQSLTDALKTQGKYFPPLMIALVNVGESTGRLERALLSLAEHYQHRVSMRRTFLMGIAWPVLQLGAAILAIGLLIWLLGVLSPPTGGEMLDIAGFGLRGTSGVVIYFGFVFLFFVLIALAVIGVRNNWLGVHNLIPLFYAIPKLGPAIRVITLSRFCWTLAMTLDAGLDPMRSVRLALESTGSDFYRSGIKPAHQAIQQGTSLSVALQRSEVIPDEFITNLEVAELSGTDAESLETLARDYDERARAAVRTLTGILTAVIWISVIVLMVFMIFRMLTNIMVPYREALSPI
ncbi:MAG: type II secretion system F family protein [Pirellulaceae bacterium]